TLENDLVIAALAQPVKSGAQFTGELRRRELGQRQTEQCGRVTLHHLAEGVVDHRELPVMVRDTHPGDSGLHGSTEQFLAGREPFSRLRPLGDVTPGGADVHPDAHGTHIDPAFRARYTKVVRDVRRAIDRDSDQIVEEGTARWV